MTDRISTEEAERIANELAAGWDSERIRGRACVALRALAAERDELAAHNAGHVELRDKLTSDLAGRQDALERIVSLCERWQHGAVGTGGQIHAIARDAAGSGENQP